MSNVASDWLTYSLYVADEAYILLQNTVLLTNKC